MVSKETLVLQKIVETYVTKNIHLVQQAQLFAQKILNYGLLEPEKTLPFQILPTNFSDSQGDVMCKLYVNLESPIYGFFTIELENDQCIITCPKTYHTEIFTATHSDCDSWIESLNDEMEVFYQISSAAEEKQIAFCNMKLNEMLGVYKGFVNPQIELLKNEIQAEPRTAIVTEQMYALANEAKKDFSRALLIPPIWVVFESLDNLPDQKEDVDDYVSIEETNELIELLDNFANQESYYAAPIYLAQRIILQSGLKVNGKSNSEECWIEGFSSEELGEFVLPPIDITEFEVK